jgi:hypothetical protein
MKASTTSVYFADAMTTSGTATFERVHVKFRARRSATERHAGCIEPHHACRGLQPDERPPGCSASASTVSGGATITGVGFELYQNQPNPFVNKTLIGFHLPEATEATLTIFDETGRMLFTQKGNYAQRLQRHTNWKLPSTRAK